MFTIRANFEPAGNLLYAISCLTGQKRHDDAYRIFGIQYAQYVKADADYTFTKALGPRSSVSFHAGLGIGVPYGNSRMLPFEKRFYAGGANSVRGWGYELLAPDAMLSRNSVTDFINQCGDIRLDLSIEYRTKLFWILEGAFFIDGGNIWTIHNYDNQPGGFFRFDSFYKEIAASYGIGLRLDFTYFLLRLDLGMKAVNPALDDEYKEVVISHRKVHTVTPVAANSAPQPAGGRYRRQYSWSSGNVFGFNGMCGSFHCLSRLRPFSCRSEVNDGMV